MPTAKLGRFEIKSLFGKGAMGEAFCAHDPMMKRDVVIKVIHFPKKLNHVKLAKLKKEFLNEVRLAAALSHKGMVQIYDVGEQDGLPFIVLELISGNLFSSFLKKNKGLDLEFIIHIFRKILSTMAYAHESGIVHLDLKPTKIMIDENGNPRVMDFGTAKFIANLREKNIQIPGTSRFMAPEQITGGLLDQRTDVFFLGTIFYLIVSGCLPFPYTDLKKLRHAIAKEPHPPLQSFDGNLPKQYYEFVNRALKKAPSDRFDSAASMLEDFNKSFEKKQVMKDFGNNSKVTKKGRREILNFILQRIKRKGDFPAVSQYVSEVIAAVRLEDSSAHGIAQSILKDISLTNKVLRMANSMYYKGISSGITTISRAVVVLGADVILSLTSAVGIFEHFLKASNLPGLKKHVIESTLSSLQAYEIATYMGLKHSEESLICSMMEHLGRLIVFFYFPEEQKAIEELIEQGQKDEEDAFRQIMRLSCAELGQAIAESWNLPELLRSGMVKLDPKHKGPLKKNVETLQCITSYASELSKASMITDIKQRRVVLKNIARKFDGLIPIKSKDLEKIIDNSIDKAKSFSSLMKIGIKELGIKSEKEIASDFNNIKVVDEDAQDKNTTIQNNTGAKPEKSSYEEDSFKSMMERQEILTKTISDITASITGKLSINDIILMALEGMYRGLGMRNVLLAMVSPKRDRLLFKFGLGPETSLLTKAFDFTMSSINEPPVISIKENKEIVIHDLDQMSGKAGKFQKIFNALNTKSIILLPLVVKNMSIGLFLSMRIKEQKVLTEMEIQNIRMLASQVGLGFYQFMIK